MEEQSDQKRVSPIPGVVVLVVVTMVGAAIVHLGRSVSDAPPPPKAAAPPASQTRLPVPDADGVVRCSSPEESAVAAGYTLAALLKRMPVDPDAFEKAIGQGPDFLSAGRILGFETDSVQVTRRGLLKETRAMILSLRGDSESIETVRSLEKRLGKGAGLPMLLARSQKRYAVLAEVREGDAVILDPLAGRVSIPMSDLLERVEGKGIVWRP